MNLKNLSGRDQDDDTSDVTCIDHDLWSATCEEEIESQPTKKTTGYANVLILVKILILGTIVFPCVRPRLLGHPSFVDRLRTWDVTFTALQMSVLERNPSA